MDWTKIKTKHFLFSTMNNTQMAGFVKLLCLTAHLEKLPTDDEMRQVCGQKTIESLSNRFQTEGKSLSNVLQKVLEDVDRVDKKRKRDREYHRTYDKSRQRGQGTNSPHREDKIREDKRRTLRRFTPPSSEDLKAYFIEQGVSEPMVEASSFMDFYESKGWKVGKNPMKDWKAAVRNWIRSPYRKKGSADRLKSRATEIAEEIKDL